MFKLKSCPLPTDLQGSTVYVKWQNNCLRNKIPCQNISEVLTFICIQSPLPKKKRIFYEVLFVSAKAFSHRKCISSLL